MRPPHFSWSRLNERLSDEAAVNILTGMETRPNESVPDPIECAGMDCFLLGTEGRLAPPFGILNPESTHRTARAGALAPRPFPNRHTREPEPSPAGKLPP